jgi:hypothetical protein
MNQPRYELSITMQIRDTQQGGYLNVSESGIAIEAETFMEMAMVLGNLHEVVLSLKKAKGSHLT